MRRLEFERLVADALRSLPPRFREKIAQENLVIEVRTRPSPRQLKGLDLGPGETLLGLYEGVPLPERTAGVDPLYPDRIFIFQEPIETSFRTRAEQVRQIQDTVKHEVGHYFGLSDAAMRELEEDGDRPEAGGRAE